MRSMAASVITFIILFATILLVRPTPSMATDNCVEPFPDYYCHNILLTIARVDNHDGYSSKTFSYDGVIPLNSGNIVESKVSQLSLTITQSHGNTPMTWALSYSLYNLVHDDTGLRIIVRIDGKYSVDAPTPLSGSSFFGNYLGGEAGRHCWAQPGYTTGGVMPSISYDAIGAVDITFNMAMRQEGC